MSISPCRSDVLRTVIRLTAHIPVVFTTGYTSREAHHLADRPNHFYMTGSMGMAGAIGMGIATSTYAPVVVVDGDGALLIEPGVWHWHGATPDTAMTHLAIQQTDDNDIEFTWGEYVTDAEYLTEPGLADISEFIADRVRRGRHATTARITNSVSALVRTHSPEANPLA